MELSKLKLSELKALCKQKGIPQYSKCNKKELIDKLAAAGVSAADSLSVVGSSSVGISDRACGSPQSQFQSRSQSQGRTSSAAQSQAQQTPPQQQSSSSNPPQSSSGDAPLSFDHSGGAYGDATATTSQGQQDSVHGDVKSKTKVAASKKIKASKKTETTKKGPISKPEAQAIAGPHDQQALNRAQQQSSTVISPARPDIQPPGPPPPQARTQAQAPSASRHDRVFDDAAAPPVSDAAPNKTVVASDMAQEVAAMPPASHTAGPSSLGSTHPKTLKTYPLSNLASAQRPNTPLAKAPISTATEQSAPATVPVRPPVRSTATSLIKPTIKIPSKRAAALHLIPAPAKRKRVQLLPSSHSTATPRTTTVPTFPSPTSAEGETPNDTYIRSHFLYTAYAALDAARTAPTGHPFPCLDHILALPIRAFRAAVRFLVARLHTLLQLGNLDYDMLWGMRLVACDLVHGDVWKIRFAGSKNGTGKEPDHEGGRGSKMAKGRAKQRDAVRASPESWEGTGEEYHFIGTTGEPIPPTRSDWAAYLLSPSPGRLIDHVKTKDGAPYDRRKGIDAGLAERVVLANCALNSFSGDKVSALQMDSECLGAPATHRSANLEFYLPESHQLLSLHSTTHPAILLAHLRLGSFYVLKDTGQMLGDEEGDGVVELWQGILGCDAKARPDAGVAGRFWAGWEKRCEEARLAIFD